MISEFKIQKKELICLLFNIRMRQTKFINVERSNQVLTNFAITLAIYQVILIIAFGIFVRMQINPPVDLLDHQRSISLFSINFMLLLGFGLLLSIVKTNSLTSLVYTLVCTALVLQMYILIQGFWVQVFTVFEKSFHILMDEKLLIKGCYCVCSVLIAMGGIIGRINPTDLVKFISLHVMGYALNEQIIYKALGAYDAGGGMTIHVFGCYYGLAVNFVLARYVRPTIRPQRSYYSNLMGLVGTMFLWLFWPLFNFGVYAENSYQRTIIVTNTYCSLAGSTVAVFIVTGLHGRGILVEDIQHATIVGGVAIAAGCGIIYVPAVSITIGFLTGLISINFIHYLNRKLEKSLKILDPHCIHSMHGIPGILGALASALIMMIYQSGYDFDVANNYAAGGFFTSGRNFIKQGGFQILALLSSFFIAILLGFGAGKFIGLFYDEREEEFFDDATYFDRNLFLNSEDKQIKYEQSPQNKKVPVVQEKRQSHYQIHERPPLESQKLDKKKSSRRSRAKEK